MSGSPFDKLRVSGVVLRSRVLLSRLARSRRVHSFLFLLVALAGVVAFVLAGRPGASAFPGALAPAEEAALAPGSAGDLRQALREPQDAAQDTAWDSGAVHAPSVVRTPTGYLLWYDGTDGDSPYAGWAIGLAASRDGLRWEKHLANPVLTPGRPGSWDGASVHDPRVVWDGQRFLMWYSGYDGARWRIGLATSDDGIRWVKQPDNPVLEPGPPGSWDEASVAYSSVVIQDGGYRMWYQGGDASGTWRIGYATSQDGVHWRKSARNPVLSPVTEGSLRQALREPQDAAQDSAWDAERAFTPHILLWDKGYLMLYTGGPGAGIGYAFSPDGERWRKAPGNPALRAPEGGQALTVTALVEGNQLVVWYAEQTGERWRIRRAETTVR